MPQFVRDKLIHCYQQLRDAHWEIQNLEFLSPEEGKQLAALHIGITERQSEAETIIKAIGEREKDPLFRKKAELKGKAFSWDSHEKMATARKLKAKLDRMQKELTRMQEDNDGSGEKLQEQSSLFGGS